MSLLFTKFKNTVSRPNISIKKFTPCLYNLSLRYGVTDTDRFREVWHNTDSLDPLYDLCKKPKTGRFDPTKRAHSYFIWSGALSAGVVAVKNVIWTVGLFLSPPRDAQAMSKLEVKMSDIPVGTCIIALWQDSPVYIWHRSEEDIRQARADDKDAPNMRDPQIDADRVKDPEWYVSMAVCTHLGCLPAFGKGIWGGFFCPCHGSHYDKAGRIRKGPAARNFDIPKYVFTDEGTILIG